MKISSFTLLLFLFSFGNIHAQSNWNSGDGAEPCIAVNPLNTDHLAITYMTASNPIDFAVFYSLDGGTNWNQSNFDAANLFSTIYGSSQSFTVSGDPVLCFDSFGDLHLTYIYSSKMLHVISSDGGATFNPPSIEKHELHVDSLEQEKLDRQWMDSDFSGGSWNGNVYLMASLAAGSVVGDGNDSVVVYIKPADSSGFNKQRVLVHPFPNGKWGLFSNLDVDDNGNIHVFFMQFNWPGLDGDYYYAKSVDGGQSFSTPVSLGQGTTSLSGQNSVLHYRDNSACSMRVDGNNVYCCWSDYSNGTVRSFFTHSNDGGLNFSPPFEFGPSLLSGTYFHIMPNLAADNDKVSISWYLTDSLTKVTSYAVATSVDAGNSFVQAQIISDSSTDFDDPLVVNWFYGDYNTSAMIDCETHSVWSDGRTSTPVVYHNKIDLCSVGLFEQSPVSSDISVGIISPNPALNSINIPMELKNTKLVKWRIIDASGKTHTSELNSQEFSNLEVNVENLPPGNYLIHLEFSNQMFATRKFIKH